jgi:hypothetical protein
LYYLENTESIGYKTFEHSRYQPRTGRGRTLISHRKKLRYFLISNFHIIVNICVDVNTEELNDVLSSIGYTQVNEDDNNNEINVEDCDGDEDKLINKEEDNSD